MGIQVNLIDDGEGVEILATGVVIGAEVLAAHAQIYDPSHLRRQRYHIVDKSGCTEYRLSADDIEAMARFDEQASAVNPDIVVAIIESATLAYSLTALWQANIEQRGCPFKTRSFTDRDAALAWIAEQIT